jgi:hypothetical protein
MADDQAKSPDMVPAAHVVAGLAQSISEDGRAMLLFQLEDGGRFAVTMPVEGLKPIRSMITDLIVAAEKRGVHSGMVHFLQPRQYQVGHSDHLRGAVVITFDPNAEGEIAVLLRNEDGLKLGTAITRDVLPRMTEKERRDAMRGESPIIAPPRPPLIVPGR